MIYAKQNGAQMATFAATGTRADKQPPNLDRTAPGALTHPLTIHYISFIHFIYLRRIALQQVDFQGALR